MRSSRGWSGLICKHRLGFHCSSECSRGPGVAKAQANSGHLSSRCQLPAPTEHSMEITKFKARSPLRRNAYLASRCPVMGTHARLGSRWQLAAHTPPQRSISRRKHDLHRRNAQSARFPANPVCGSRAQRLPGRAHVPMIGRAGHARLGARRLSVSGGRCPEM